jgi:hypothetical protein
MISKVVLSGFLRVHTSTQRRSLLGGLRVVWGHIPDHGLACDCFVDCGVELVVGEAVEPDRVNA